MRGLLRPTAAKILVFLSPTIFELIFWLVVVAPRGIDLQSISNVIQTVWQTLSFPGLILCSLVPSCTQLRGDIVYTNPYLFYLSSFIVVFIWYLISASIGSLFGPFLRNVTTFFTTKFKTRPIIVSIVGLFVLVTAFYLISYFMNRAFWYGVSGGKNVDAEKWECTNQRLNVRVKNLGFETVSFDEVQIYADKYPVSCNWSGKLTVGSTAICTSQNPLEDNPDRAPGWHDIEIKTPVGSSMTSVYCQQ